MATSCAWCDVASPEDRSQTRDGYRLPYKFNFTDINHVDTNGSCLPVYRGLYTSYARPLMYSHSEQPQFLEAGVATVPDDDVIEHVNAQ